MGDQCGREGSWKSSVIFSALPPDILSDQRLFCRSMITVSPSGETVAAMLVPSWKTRFRVEHELPLGTAASPPKKTAVSTKAGARRDDRRCGCKGPCLLYT